MITTKLTFYIGFKVNGKVSGLFRDTQVNVTRCYAVFTSDIVQTYILLLDVVTLPPPDMLNWNTQVDNNLAPWNIESFHCNTYLCMYYWTAYCILFF